MRLLIGWVAVSAPATLSAQLVADGDTGVLAGVVTNVTGKLIVGTNAPFTLLLVTNGARVTGSSDTAVGMNLAANNNRLVVTGSGSVWSCAGTLFAGENGSYNELDVLDGAVVTNAAGYLGKNNSSRSNLVLVSGTNSAWVNQSVLYFTSFNQLTISNGATAAAAGANMGYFYLPGANNHVVVTDSGSRWTMSGDLSVGSGTPGNQVLVTNGGTVVDSRGFIGGPNAVSNWVTVTGSGSTWTNDGNVKLGGDFGQLLVTDGGTVSCISATLGDYGSGNLTLVADAGSLLASTSLYVGNRGYGNQLIVSNGAVVACDSFRLEGNGGVRQRAVVTGSGSLITNRSDTFVGPFGGSNQLFITDGGVFADNSGYIDGANYGGNLAVVAGTDATWTNRSDLYVGWYWPLNHLVVTNAGNVVNANGYIGYDAASRSNTVVVADAGSVWSNRADLCVGYSGVRNRLYVTNAGTVANAIGYIGYTATSVSNLVVVAGTNSLWTNRSDLYVGCSGILNQLLVTNAGIVVSSNGHIGYYPSSHTNTVIVADPGSLWINHGSLDIGRFGMRNRLYIRNGGRVADANGYVGYNSGSASNLVVVADTDSLWTNSTNLCVGTVGPFSQLLITNGASVEDSRGSLGEYASSFSNRVVITDPGSTWRTSGPLYCGFAGKGNEVVVSNSGSLLASYLYLGHYGIAATSTSNTLMVTGGNLFITNTLEANYYGTIRLDGGFLSADTLQLAGGNQGKLVFNGGTLRTRTTTSPNAAPFVIGNGSGAAAFEMTNSGTHTFAGQVVVASNATLRGVGTISADVSVADGGAVSPGSPGAPGPSTAQIAITGNLVLSNGSTTILRLNADSGAADNFAGLTSVTFGGTLQLKSTGGMFRDGNAFRLFSAGSYARAFTDVSPPVPGPYLKWNLSRLKVDGVLRVVVTPTQPPRIASAVAAHDNVLISAMGGTAYDPCLLLSSTNLAVPPGDWEPWATNCFDGSGQVGFTNAVSPGEPQRYFRLRVE